MLLARFHPSPYEDDDDRPEERLTLTVVGTVDGVIEIDVLAPGIGAQERAGPGVVFPGRLLLPRCVFWNTFDDEFANSADQVRQKLGAPRPQG